MQAAAQQAAGALLAKAEVALPVGAKEEQKLLQALVMALEEHMVSRKFVAVPVDGPILINL